MILSWFAQSRLCGLWTLESLDGVKRKRIVFIVRGPGALSLHARNQAAGKTICGQEIDPERPRVSCQVRQVSLARALGVLQELLEVMDHELLQELLSEASARAS